MANSSVLKLDSLTMQFGGLVAVDAVNLEVNDGDLVGLIGPNGAGKTTIFNMITGVYKPTKGEVLLDGSSVIGLYPAKITHKGIARTFQNIRLFKDLSVIDNLKIASHFRMSYGLMDAAFNTKKKRDEEEKLHQECLEFLKIFDMDSKANLTAKNLPYGEQRRLEIARALATRPKLLLLDEPAAGMNPLETKQLNELIKWIRDHFKISILLIEHDMSLVMEVCEKIYCVDHGVLIAQGTPSEIQKNPKVIEAYLGADHEVIES